MRVHLLNQPARDLLGEELLELLGSPDTRRFWAASAWVRRPALRRLEAELSALSARVAPGECRGLFGVELGGTTHEGLELAGRLFGQVRVLHASGARRTFHPKLYICEQSARAVVYAGSANLTTGGLWGNFETGFLIELDLAEATDRELLDQARSWYEQWWSEPDGTRPVTAAILDALERDPEIRLPREGDVREVLVRKGGREPRRSKRVFERPIGGLRALPPAPRGAPDEAEPEQPATVLLPGVPLEELKTPAREEELRVLLAGIRHDRWRQVGFNRQVTEDFFHVYANGDVLWIEGVGQSGVRAPARQATLVFPSGSNQNHRIEFPEPARSRRPQARAGAAELRRAASGLARRLPADSLSHQRISSS